MNGYKPTIGIEIHLKLKTNAKAFSNSLNDYSASPNTNINEIDFAYPGVLPLVNEGAVRKAIKACLGLNMNITRVMHFDRKNYFYPDLPKGYQITQFETPIGRDGFVDINVCGKAKRIGVSDIHIEEDTCKSLHHKGKTLLNYNRAGVPLIEIVSCPDMHSSFEAMAYAEAIRDIMLYLNISDCKIEEGSIRFDVNVSVSPDDTLGVRSEIKNIGSISNIGEAIDYEIARKVKALDDGEVLEEDTRRFDDVTKTTVFMRKKDSNTDYRYFPEPDIPYLYLDEGMIDDERDHLEMLPNERRALYLDRGISLVNVDKLIANKDLSDFLGCFLDSKIDFKIASNILLGDISSYLNREKISIFDTKLSKDKFILLVNSLSNGDISSKVFKEVFEDILKKDIDVKSVISKNKQVSDPDEIMVIIKKVVSLYPDSVNDYKNGKENALKFLMGMIMKESKGKLNPSVSLELLRDFLSK